MTVLSIITFFFVKTVDTATMNKKSNEYFDDPLAINSEKIITKSRIDLWLETFSEKSKKIMGIGLAICSGILFGNVFNDKEIKIENKFQIKIFLILFL